MNIEEKKAQLQKIADEFNQLIKSSDRESAMPYLYKFLANEEAFGQYINIVFLNNTPNLRFFDQTVLFVLATDPDVRQIMLGKIAKHLGVKREEPKKEEEPKKPEATKELIPLKNDKNIISVTSAGETFNEKEILAYRSFYHFLARLVEINTGEGRRYASKRALAKELGVNSSYFHVMKRLKRSMPSELMHKFSKALLGSSRTLDMVWFLFTCNEGKAGHEI